MDALANVDKILLIVESLASDIALRNCNLVTETVDSL
jgi:hypothetical protein